MRIDSTFTPTQIFKRKIGVGFGFPDFQSVVNPDHCGIVISSPLVK